MTPTIHKIISILARFGLGGCLLSFLALPGVFGQSASNANVPVVKKVEPPSWWVGLTPDLMLLISGQNLKATHVSCNLQDVIVGRTQASADGAYLFVWLRFEAELKTGTAVCRIATNSGETTFELPIAARKQILGRNQGLSLDDVIYLIMPDRFANGDPTNDEPAEFPGSHDRAKPRAWHGGDLRGVREHLPYLKDLGVTTLWLTPVVKNGGASDYHGYAASDLYNVDPHLGTVGDYRELVEAAHQQHMKVFFDAVPNHVGALHPWVANPPLPDWFHGTKEQHISTASPVMPSFYGQPEKSGNPHDLFESLADPHATAQMRRNLTDGWFVGVLPDLNTEDPMVEQYLVQNSIWWAETSGLDGYRVDTFPYVGRKFWADWHASLRKIYPRLSTIGETFHPDPVVTSFFVGGRKEWDNLDTGLTTVFDFPMYFVLRDVLLHKAPAGCIANILRQDSLYPHPEFLVPFFANHDVTRFAGDPAFSPAKLKLAYGLTLTLRGVPQLYYGDEIALPGGGDPDNRRDFPGGWPGDQRDAFTKAGRTPEQQEIFDTVQTLLRLRREHDALREGKLWHLSSGDATYVFLRESEEERLAVAFNNSATARDMSISLKDTPGGHATEAVPLYGDATANIAGAQLRLHLPPQAISIFALR